MLPGGRYSARQNEDGTWDVMDVPFFTLVPKGVKGAPRDVTENDLHSAVSIHQRKFNEDKYLPRLNVLHNYGIHRPQPAGFFLPRYVKPFRMDRKTRPTVFADLLAIPDETFRKMDKGEIPYCSAEVRTYEPLTFGALALLDTEPPFFEFPNITIGEKEGAEVVRFENQGGPALAMASADGTSRYLFRFAEDSMDDEKKPDEAEKVEEGEANMEEGDGDLKGAISAIEAKMKEFTPLLELLPKLQEMLAGPQEEEESIEEAPIDEPVPALSADTDEAARLKGRVAALELFRDNQTKKEETQARFSAAVESLENDGYNLSDKERDLIFQAAEESERTLSLFTEGFREVGIKDPPKELDGIPGGDTAWPSEVMAYSHRGPSEFEAAKAEYRVWKEIPDDQHRSPLDKFLERGVG